MHSIKDDHTVEGTKWVARPHASISAPSNLAPVRPTYSPTKREDYHVNKVSYVIL